MSAQSVILLSLATVASTLAGGLFAFRFWRLLDYILAYSAGVLLGVVAFDILPEIFRLAERRSADPQGAMIALVLGFFIFHVVEKFIVLHSHETPHGASHEPHLGVLSAGALAAHSFLDGLAIGVGFQVSAALGIAVLLAVVAHDFCDGLNTVALMLVHRNPARRSLVMLAVDAATPVAGAAASFAVSPSPGALMLYLGFFAGFLLYIATADILPKAYAAASRRASLALMALTAFGAAFMLVASRLANGL